MTEVKAALIIFFLITMDQIAACNVKGTTRRRQIHRVYPGSTVTFSSTHCF